MKKKVRLILLSLTLIVILGFSLSSCLGPNTRRIGEDEIIESLETDYGINVEKNYCSFNLQGGDNLGLLDYGKAKEKLNKWADNLSVLYIKTDKGEDKFVYYPRSIAKVSIKENGQTIYAEIKDYIYISDFPFTYTYDEIKQQCSEITDEDIKNEMLNAFNNGVGCLYRYLYPIAYKTSFQSFSNEEATLINSHLVDKELVFMIPAKYNDKMYYYYFFYIKEGSDINLYIYREAWQNINENSKIIYPSSMTKDEFINHLKTL